MKKFLLIIILLLMSGCGEKSLPIIDKQKEVDKIAFSSTCKMIISSAEKHYALGIAINQDNSGTYTFNQSNTGTASSFVTANNIVNGNITISKNGTITITRALTDGVFSTSDSTCETIVPY